MEPLISYPTFERQRKQITSLVADINEELYVSEKLITGLRKHSKHMAHVVTVPSAETFPMIFVEANSSLSRYNQILTEINCKLEVLLRKQIGQWNNMCIKDSTLPIKPFKWDDETKIVNQSGKNPEPKNSTVIPAKNKTENPPSVESNKLEESNNRIKTDTVDVPVKKSKSLHKQKRKKKAKAAKKSLKDESKEHSTGVTKHESQIASSNVEKSKECPPVRGAASGEVVPKQKKEVPSKGVIENVKLESYQSYQGLVVLVVSPIEFYIYFITQDTEEFSNCTKLLESYYKNYKFQTTKTKVKSVQARKNSSSITLGDYALLKLQSDFHRVRIRDWNLTINDDLVTVDLVDIGGTRKVSVFSLYPIPKKLMKFPSFATKCHLEGFPKIASQMQIAADFFQTWVDGTKSVNIKINDIKSSVLPDSVPVVLYDSTGSCINKLIISIVEENEDQSFLKELEVWDPMAEAYKSGLNVYDFDLDDPAASIYGYVGTDYDRVCKQYGSTGKCYKKGCRKEHVLLDPKGFTTDKEEIYIRALNPLIIPQVKVLKVWVTHVESPTSFYCTLDTPNVSSKEESLQSLHSYMNQKQNISQMKKLLIPPAVGQIVIAKFPNDQSWHRARVISVLPEMDECRLIYVDIGCTANVYFSDIRLIEPQYLHFPFQAIFCEICGIGDIPDTYHEAIRFLNDNLTDLSTVEIVSSLPGEHPHLLVNLYTSKGENMARQLLANQLVSYKENFHLDQSRLYLPG